MRSQPHFAEAARMMCRTGLSRYADSPVIYGTIRDAHSAVYGFLILYVHVTGVITQARVQEVCHGLSLMSPGRAVSILAQLRKLGFIHPDPGQNSRRERRYVLDPAFESVYRAIIRDGLTALSLIEPEAAAAVERLEEPEFFAAFVIKTIELVFRQKQFGTFYFAEHNNGQIILYDIILSAQRDDEGFPPKGEMKASLRDLARRYNVSRAHVFRLFAGAEELGLLKRDAKTQTCVLSVGGRTALRSLAIMEFIGCAVAAEHARRVTAANARASASQ